MQNTLRLKASITAALFIVGCGLAVWLCWPGVARMVRIWFGREEYSHGVLIPFISAYLIWQRLNAEPKPHDAKGALLGLLVVLVGLATYAVGELSSLFVIIQYGFIFIIYGLAASVLGVARFRLILVPLLILLFMIPLPEFLYNNLSARLQLLSSELGVAVIRAFGISVFLEGNVIDLGTYKLQVVEACNGLRYLFPLMTLGFLVAYLYKAEFWKRALIFLSTIPITVLMNSFRIGVIGVMVDRWGQEMAEGFLHDFEGWAVFMACFGVLFIEMWILMRISGDRRPLSSVFGLEVTGGIPKNNNGILPLQISRSFYAALFVLAAAVAGSTLLPHRTEEAQPRKQFSEMPLSFGSWKGTPETMEQVYVDALKFTDYALINFRDDTGHVVNFYSVYYASQRKGESVHSPRSCLPGGGWEIKSLTQRDIEGVSVDGVPLRVNRVLIGYGDQKQLVYYWFQQRGRVITNEYLVKWDMLVDAITRNRTDGALVRLVIPMRDGQDVAELDAALARFSADVSQFLPAYIPN